MYLQMFQTVIEVGRALPALNWAAFTISFITCTVIAFNNELLKVPLNFYSIFNLVTITKHTRYFICDKSSPKAN